MGVPELVHSIQQHLSNPMRHPSSHTSRDIHHYKVTTHQSPAVRNHTAHSRYSTGPQVLQFSSSSALISFQKTYHKLISSIKWVLLLSKTQKAETGICQNRTWDCWLYIFFLFKNDFIYLFLEREEKRERNINVLLPLVHPQLGAWPTIQACAPTGNWTSGPLVCRPVLKSIEPRQPGCIFLLEHEE